MSDVNYFRSYYMWIDCEEICPKLVNLLLKLEGPVRYYQDLDCLIYDNGLNKSLIEVYFENVVDSCVRLQWVCDYGKDTDSKVKHITEDVEFDNIEDCVAWLNKQYYKYRNKRREPKFEVEIGEEYLDAFNTFTGYLRLEKDGSCYGKLFSYKPQKGNQYGCFEFNGKGKIDPFKVYWVSKEPQKLLFTDKNGGEPDITDFVAALNACLNKDHYLFRVRGVAECLDYLASKVKGEVRTSKATLYYKNTNASIEVYFDKLIDKQDKFYAKLYWQGRWGANDGINAEKEFTNRDACIAYLNDMYDKYADNESYTYTEFERKDYQDLFLDFLKIEDIDTYGYSNTLYNPNTGMTRGLKGTFEIRPFSWDMDDASPSGYFKYFGSEKHKPFRIFWYKYALRSPFYYPEEGELPSLEEFAEILTECVQTDGYEEEVKGLNAKMMSLYNSDLSCVE